MSKHINIDTPDNSELREAVKDGLANHTGKFANPWMFKGNYSHELLTDILNDIMASERLFKNLEALINKQIIEARNNSLLDLEQWVKLHDLDKEMILDGIEHMVKSNLQVPDQPRLDHSDRLTQLRITKKDK